MNEMESLLNQLKVLEQKVNGKEIAARAVKEEEKKMCLNMEAIERASIMEDDYKWIGAELKNIINIYACMI